jgi:hypothetical protein
VWGLPADFYMAKDFSADVLGIDLSQNMLAIAHERATDPANGAQGLVPLSHLIAIGAVMAVCGGDVGGCALRTNRTVPGRG